MALTTIALVVLSWPFSGAVQAQTSSETTTSVMSHMTMVVADIEVSKRFYNYGLGYELQSDSVIANPQVKTQMGVAQDRSVRFAILRSSHIIEGKKREGAQLGLIQVGNPTLLVMKRPGSADLASGETMMALRTTNMALVYARMKEMKVRILLEPMTSPDGKETELVVHDPTACAFKLFSARTAKSPIDRLKNQSNKRFE